MHGHWGHQADPAMAMFMVIPAEEPLAVSTSILDRAEAIGEVRSVLQGFELCLRVRIVIRDVRAAVGLGDLEVDQECSDRLRSHAGAPISVQREGPWGDVFFLESIGDQLLGELGRLSMRDHPADDVAAVDVEDHVQMEAGPFCRTLQWSERPDVVELSSGLSAPNRTCASPRIRLSVSSVAHGKDEIGVT